MFPSWEKAPLLLINSLETKLTNNYYKHDFFRKKTHDLFLHDSRELGRHCIENETVTQICTSMVGATHLITESQLTRWSMQVGRVVDL